MKCQLGKFKESSIRDQNLLHLTKGNQAHLPLVSPIRVGTPNTRFQIKMKLICRLRIDLDIHNSKITSSGKLSIYDIQVHMYW